MGSIPYQNLTYPNLKDLTSYVLYALTGGTNINEVGEGAFWT